VRSIIRVKHDRDAPYLLIAKETLRYRKISFTARGFLAFLLAKPDDWRVRPEELSKECGLGLATIYRYLGELLKAGYVRSNPIVERVDHGHFRSTTMYWIYETRALCRDAADRERFKTTGEIEAARADTRIDGEEVPF